jgi:EAL and modified HD-GYP domain-containing signal transduction protein
MTQPAARAREEPIARRPVPSYPQIIKIMNMVREETDIAEIEDELKADPVISYRLMIFVNSAGMGFPREIKSFRQAVTILGYHQLYRWLTMLLVTADPQDGRSDVGQNAIIRGRFLELIGKVHFGKTQADDLFVVGAFSLLDALFGEPMEKLLEPLSISLAMRDALTKRDGPYVPLLLLAEAIEKTDESRIDTFHKGLRIPIEVIYDAYNDALKWAEKFGA